MKIKLELSFRWLLFKTFFNPPFKWTEECPWYQRVCIHANRKLRNAIDWLPWRQIAYWKAAYKSCFITWRRTAEHAHYLEDALEKMTHAWKEEHERLRLGDAKHRELEQRFMRLRAQVMNLRVSQASEGRTGWEVMAYIPEEVVKKITEWQKNDPDLFEGFMFNVARPLVRNAIKGLVHVNSQGRVNALVFEPLDMNGPVRAPKWVLALYETPEGKMRFSERAKIIDPGTEEQRAKRASG